MSFWKRQIDEYLPKRVVLLIGAGRTYAARLNFFLGVPNTLMIAVLFYHDSALIQSVFPTVYAWVAFILVGVVPAAFAVDRIILHPSQIAYNSHQTAQEERSPNFRETMENQRRITRLEEKVDRLLAVADGGDALDELDAGDGNDTGGDGPYRLSDRLDTDTDTDTEP